MRSCKDEVDPAGSLQEFRKKVNGERKLLGGSISCGEVPTIDDEFEEF